ncbi:MAG: hypothetical protein GWP70_04895 [Proteobacteria bacterium]|nr:hypothetical protein [Pseudomonadota bacterium]
MFAVVAWQPQERVIRITQGDIQRIEEQWQQQMRRPPAAAERQSLISQLIRDEALYQEAIALNLDAGDTIVRRRLIQKLAFLTEDLATAEPPQEAQLRRFHAEHQGNYQVPEQFSFQHIYFSADRAAEAAELSAEALATRAVADPTMAGDPFMLQRSYTQRSSREIGDLFGRAFARDLAGLQVQTNWQGPLRSAYGWHAIQLTHKRAAADLSYEQVAEKVLIDWQQQQRSAANKAYIDNLLATYTIQLPTGLQATHAP